MRLAVAGEDFADGDAGRLLDLGVGVTEGHAPARGEAPADGGFAGPWHPHQHDAVGEGGERGIGVSEVA